MPVFTNEVDLNTHPLTKEEKTWCRKVENLFKKTPARFGVYTIGDPCITIFDKDACDEMGIEQEECNPGRAGLNLAFLASSECIQGWCG